MESILLAINPRDPLWILVAFTCGFLVNLVGLPPLIGFLVAGFLLNIAGAEGGVFLNMTADLGVTLLLFTIGLKLHFKSLARPEIVGVAVIHMTLVTLLLTAVITTLASFSLPLISDIDISTALMIGFALSFSSTVFAVKILDKLGTTSSCYGQTTIGVLVIQDIAAVVFLALSIGKLPSIWAIALLALIPLRHLFYAILSRSGHGELLVLFGILLALGGADLFELFSLKGDLGALIFGMLLANHPKANEMSKTLLRFKDLFLLGFFLSIGMTSLPGPTEILIGLLLVALLPIKTAIYFGLFAAFKLRASTSWRSSLTLANYSEFGLIIGAIATSAGLLPKEWLAVFAIALSFSFLGAAPIVAIGDRLYARWRPRFKLMERSQRLVGEMDLDVGKVDVLIFGMGRVGSAVYDAIVKDHPGRVLGIDLELPRVKSHIGQQRNVKRGDATNPDFWTRAPGLTDQLKWVILALPQHPANVAAVKHLGEIGFEGRIASTTKYADEAEQLEKLGVEFAFNIYAEAGKGFANDLKRRFHQPLKMPEE